jgi:type II secretory pathway pseudopilin PulG
MASRVVSRHRSPASHHGQALIAILLIIGFGIAALVYALATPATITIENDQKTAAALAQAKDALIGYAAGQPNLGNFRPGELPCPDTNDDGNEENTCDTPASRVGRLPWKSLRLPDPRDGSGERLWYAVSATFRNATQTGILNSDTAGDFTVVGTTPANNVIAIVFAPGAPVGGQDRNPATTALCPTTGTTIARNRCVTNYLEGGNEDGDMLYTTGLPTPTFNDKVLLITSDVLFPAVIMRVAREASSFLQAYFTAHHYYPFANDFADATFNCTTGQLRGRIPIGDLSSAPCNLAVWGTPSLFPPWFTPNNWHQVAFYAVAPACTSPVGDCLNAGGFLTVNGMPAPNNDKRAIVIVTGRGLAAQSRPCTTVTDCLEDPENTNGDNTYANNPVTAAANDRLVIVAP